MNDDKEILERAIGVYQDEYENGHMDGEIIKSRINQYIQTYESGLFIAGIISRYNDERTRRGLQ